MTAQGAGDARDVNSDQPRLPRLQHPDEIRGRTVGGVLHLLPQGVGERNLHTRRQGNAVDEAEFEEVGSRSLVENVVFEGEGSVRVIQHTDGEIVVTSFPAG